MYQCSSLGKIKTLDRYVKAHKGMQFRKGQKITLGLNKNGYLQVSLYKDNKRKVVYVHRIIAETFISDEDFSKTVNHKDGNRLNNAISNLEWCTYSENNTHSYQKLNRKINRFKGRINVSVVDVELNRTLTYPSVAETSRSINLSETQIRRYLNTNKKWKERYLFYSSRNKCVEDNEKIS